MRILILAFMVLCAMTLAARTTIGTEITKQGDTTSKHGSAVPNDTFALDTVAIVKQKNYNQMLGVAVGANFDFVDGVTPNSAYVIANAGDRFFLLDGTVYDKRIGIGFESMIFRNRSVSGFDTVVNMATSYSPLASDPSSVIETSARTETEYKRTLDNLGLGTFLSLNFEPLKNNFFAVVSGAEFRRQVVSHRSNASRTTITSATVPTGEIVPSPIGQLSMDTTVNQWWYYVVGFEIATVSKFVSWRVTGFPRVIQRQDGNETLHSYAYRFSLVEHSFGIEIGGELRGVYDKPGSEYIIYLGKRFNFSKLLDFF